MRLDAVITRREFLRVLAAASAAIAMWLLGPLATLRRMIGQESLASRLRRIFRIPGSAAAVGRIYLRNAPQEADERRLVRLICPSTRRWQMADAGRLRRLIARQQQQDFRLGRVVQVDGWMLSATEARLCALAAVRGRWR